MDLSLFSNPWEHLRLLSDAPRNEALLELLRRRAPGARVVEVGCGTGLLSLAAARLGAERVYAVEPTPLVEVAQELVRANHLQDRVVVLSGAVEDLVPRPVDLAFSELLNAEPFLEGILDASDAVAPWVVPGGHLAPHRLRVWVALVRDAGSTREARDARRQVQALSQRLDLEIGPLRAALQQVEPYRYLAGSVSLASRPALVWELALGTGERPAERVRVEVEVDEPGPVGGAVVWFEATYDEGLVLDNAPGRPGHWGHAVSAWDQEVGARLGSFALELSLDGEMEVEVRPG